MSEINITIQGGTTKRLLTAGKYCPSDILVTAEGSSGGIQLSSIAITTAPTKTEYGEGESFDASGMVVTATYSNGATKVITDYTYSPSGALSLDTTAVTISYTEDGVTATTTQAVTVKDVVILTASGDLQSSYAYVQLTSTSKITSATTVEIEREELVSGYPKVYVSSSNASVAKSCEVTLNGTSVQTGSGSYSLDITNCKTVNIVFSAVAYSFRYDYYTCAITTT